MKSALISDDLTRALGAADMFAADGLRTEILVVPEAFELALCSDADVNTVFLRSRDDST